MSHPFFLLFFFLFIEVDNDLANFLFFLVFNDLSIEKKNSKQMIIILKWEKKYIFENY